MLTHLSGKWPQQLPELQSMSQGNGSVASVTSVVDDYLDQPWHKGGTDGNGKASGVLQRGIYLSSCFVKSEPCGPPSKLL